ncbi:MAG: hypothetical protein FGM55_11050, partial [Rhodoferax sp.]|nr:hypothetical protein [Rhodoferax sp.]
MAPPAIDARPVVFAGVISGPMSIAPRATLAPQSQPQSRWKPRTPRTPQPPRTPVHAMKTEPMAAYACNGVRVDAAHFYAVACDPGRSVVVEACAGAGKTWMLVSRMLRALLEAVDPVTGRFAVAPQEILAITFTRRAAGEMRARLQQWLQSYSGAPEELLRQELRVRGIGDDLGPQALSDKARLLSNLYRLLLEDGRQVQIRTFHSWFATLLRTAPLSLLEQLGLPADHELLEDDAPARVLLWPRFYQALMADDEASRGLRSDFETAVAQHGRSQTLKALASALDKRIEFELAHAAGAVARSVARAAQQFPAFAPFARPSAAYWDDADCQESLWSAARAMGQGTPGVVAKAVELEQALQSQDVVRLQRVLMTQEGLPRKFSDRLAGIEQIRQAQDWVQRVLSAERQHEAWLHQQRMMRLSVRLFQEYAALKRERGWVDMNDLEHAARVLLGDPVLSGWVQQ